MANLITFVLANEAMLFELAFVLASLAFPSIITALGRKPGPTTNAGIAALQWLLDRLSVLTHSNSPGTLKFPFTGSGPASAAADPVNTPRSAGFADYRLIGGLGLALMLFAAFGCATGWTAAEKAAPACYGLNSSSLSSIVSEGTSIVSDASQCVSSVGASCVGDIEAALATYLANKNLDLQAFDCVTEAIALEIKYPKGGEPAFVPDAGPAPIAVVTSLPLMTTPQKTTALQAIDNLRSHAAK